MLTAAPRPGLPAGTPLPGIDTRLPALEDRSDSELLEMFRAGLTDAYGTLSNRYQHQALRTALRQTRDRQLAMDSVLETFANILVALKAGRGPVGTFAAYLHSSVRREVHHQHRRSSRETPLPDEHLETSCEDKYNLVEDDTVSMAYSTLPARWQLVLWHMDINETPAREAAALFGLSPNAVIALRGRARNGLRLALHAAQTRTGPAITETLAP
jgi:RNA polymerase sigma factor (sigma-70 family)